jgi:uncharacterized protein
MLSNTFHLAVPAGNLDTAIDFYCKILGCKKGNSETNDTDSWVDIDFWGNELTLHATKSNPNIDDLEIHNVDMGEVLIPHFGVHLTIEDFSNLKERLEKYGISYISKPHVRFKNTDLEQETMFIKDTHCNILEIKTLKNPDKLFITQT